MRQSRRFCAMAIGCGTIYERSLDHLPRLKMKNQDVPPVTNEVSRFDGRA
jgi:hypothetical protein